MEKVKTVLVTGGAGFIGSTIVKRLLNSGDIVHVLDDLSTGSLENLPKHPNLYFHHGSIMNKQFVESLKEIEFDMLFHLASIVGMRLATKYHKLVYDTCTVGTSNILDTFKGVPAVLFSSSAVYGTDNKHAVSESQQVSYDQLLKYDANDPGYACGKWAMEQIGIKESESGRKVLILRPFNVVGQRQVGTYGMVVPTFVNNAINGKPLTVFDDGFQVRSFSEINTFVECIFRLLPCEEAWTSGKNIINIGSKNGSSINDLAFIVLEETQSESPIKYCFYEEFFPNHKDVVYRVPDTSYGETYFGNIEWPSLRTIVMNIVQSKTVHAVN
ncbi:MAG TPA: NAD-dependent epimerase/dehydratase family protein [Panacibacter sp.]|nr:NAD-dependent epimerase/dehydratase family protein [Panacibacter sp.]HNP45513.1 NAD-dependent epimerase/dehydratase family protein [Panacibacter sp.]